MPQISQHNATGPPACLCPEKIAAPEAKKRPVGISVHGQRGVSFSFQCKTREAAATRRIQDEEASLDVPKGFLKRLALRNNLPFVLELLLVQLANQGLENPQLLPRLISQPVVEEHDRVI